MLVASPGWTPSAARTVALLEPPSTQLRGISVATIPLAWSAKAPSEELDYALDPTTWLADGDDSLSTFSAALSSSGQPTDTAVVWQSIINSLLVLFLAGGTPNVTYTVTFTVTTAAGRIGIFTVSLPVSGVTAAAAPPPPTQAPPNAITSSAGLLGLDNGSLLLLA